MMTSGLSCASHFLEKSKPLKTGFQYGSWDFLLSQAAPMAGTCDTLTLATIFATYLPAPAFFAHSDLLRLPSIGRPPFNIICAYCSLVRPVMVAAMNWKDFPSVE